MLEPICVVGLDTESDYDVRSTGCRLLLNVANENQNQITIIVSDGQKMSALIAAEIDGCNRTEDNDRSETGVVSGPVM